MNDRKRLAAGRPIMGEHANAADTVAHLAGVSFGSVVKVFAALEAMKITLQIPPALRIERTIDMPLKAPRFDGTEAERMRVTRELAQRIAGHPDVQYLDNILQMSGRFSHATVENER